MNKKIRIVLIIMIIIFVIILTGIIGISNTNAATAGTIKIVSKEVNLIPGGEIVIKINIENQAEDIQALSGVFEYNTDIFEDITVDDIIIPNVEEESILTKIYGKTTKKFITSFDSFYFDIGELMEVTFKIKEDADLSQINDLVIEFYNAQYSTSDYKTLYLEDGKIEYNVNNPSSDLYLSSEKYKIGNNDIKNYETGDKYISRVEKGTILQEFIDNLDTNGEIKVTRPDGTEVTMSNSTDETNIVDTNSIDTNIVNTNIVENNVIETNETDTNNIVDTNNVENNVIVTNETNTSNETNVIDTDIELEEFIGTGMKLTVTKGDETIELQIAVSGDLDGDGKVTATDLSTLNQAVLKMVTLENEFKIAGDLDENDNITATDLSTINKMVLKLI